MIDEKSSDQRERTNRNCAGAQNGSSGTLAGGNLSVEGTLCVCREGEMVDVLSLGQPPVSHLHRQTEQSALWQIDHPLNTRFPAVRLFIENKEVFAHIVYETATDSHIDVSFVNPCVGFAILTY